MNKLKKNILTCCLLTLGLNSFAQQGNMLSGDYDDYGAFATDPVDLDQEVQELFGRYFQMAFLAGSSIFIGDLGSAYSSGFLSGVRFVLYYDRIWALEFHGMWGQNEGQYNEANTGKKNVDISLTSTVIPFGFGFRYGFDLDALPRGLALMHPYFSAGPEVIFRSESTKSGATTDGLDSSEKERFAEQSTRNTTGYGVHMGGGVEFDIYRKKLFLGGEARYHYLYWSDGGDFVGDLGRNGHMFTLLASLNYNY